MSEVITPTNQVAALEKQQADSRIMLQRREMALRLATNPDFRTLILDGFCLHDAARYAQESADPFLNIEQRADALALAQASGHLKRWLSLTVRMGEIAERNLNDLQDEIEMARQEEGQI